MSIKKIGIIANIDKEKSDEYTKQLRDCLSLVGSRCTWKNTLREKWVNRMAWTAGIWLPRLISL